MLRQEVVHYMMSTRLFPCFLLIAFLWTSAVFDASAATRIVTTNANAGAGSLRAQIGASADGDIVEISSTLSTITLTAQIEISTSLTITGPAADEFTLSGGSSARLFYVNASGKTVTMNGIKFLNGRSQATPVLNFIAGGGAIFHSAGILNIDECEFEGNVTDDGNGSTSFGYGGAIMSQAELHVTNTTFYNNSLNNLNAFGGGAVYCQDNTTDHDVSFNNCTFFSNSVINGNSGADGGALAISENTGSGTDTAPLVTITNCTFYDNNSNNNGEEIYIFSNGPDVSITLRNNIFDRDASDGGQVSVECDCTGGITATSNGGNIYWDTPDAQIPTGGTRDQTGQGVDGAGLSGTLSLYGGPTRTIDIIDGTSLADDNGVSGGPTLSRDQRDFTREGNPDSGAFEFEGLFTYETIFPADNSTNASVTTNLIMTFAHNVTIGSGNILLRHVTSAAVHETIAVGSAAVTGGGTKTLTINPTLALPGSTSIYVEVPQTALVAPDGDSEIEAISGSSAWNFDTAPAPNSAPLISTNNTAVTMLEDGQGTLYVDVSDAESSTINLVLTAASADITLVPTANIIQLGLTTATSSFRVTTAGANTNGTVAITITVTDEGGLTASTTFNLTVLPVNDAPTFNTGANVTVLEDSGAYSAAFATSIDDGDPETTQTVSFVVAAANTTLFAVQPTVNSVGVLTFTPANNSNGNTTVDIYLRDDGGTANGGQNTSATQTFNISITPVNDAPSFTTIANVTVNEDAGATTATVVNNINDGDAETTQTLAFVVTNNNAALFTVQPTVNSVGVMNFTPVGNSNGTARVTLYLRDDGGTANGGQNTSATQTFDITVNAVNDAPSFNTGANVTVLEDSGAYSAAFATSIDDGDPETTQTVSFVVAAANTTLFAVQPTVNSVGVLTFTPANNSNGTTTVDIYLRDDGGTANGGQNTSATQTFNISITPVNDAPSFTTIANVTVNEDAGATTATVVNNINDGDAETTQTLAFVVTNNNAALFTVQPTVNSVGVVNFTPVGNSNGTARVTLYLRDDGGTANGGQNTSATQTFDITVNAVNDAPTFNTGANVTVLEDSGAYSAAFATSIDDGDPETTQTVSFVVAAANTTLFAVQPTVNSVGVLSFTPANNSNGTTTVDIYLRDNGGTANGGQNTSATRTFNISITPVNDAPSFATIANVTVNEDAGATTATVVNNINDGDAETTQTLAFVVTNNNAALFTVQPTVNSVGVVNFTPVGNSNGTARVTLYLRDDGGTANGGQNTSATQTFDITVNAVNDAPKFNTGANVTVLEDSGAYSAAFATSIDDGDPETTQTVSFVVAAANTTLFAVQPTVNSVGVLSFTPANNSNGTTTVDIYLRDNGGTANGGQNTSATQTFNISITPVNDAPSFTTIANVTVNEDAGATTATVANNINDGDAETIQTLAFVVTNNNAALFTVQPTVNSVGVVNFTPVGNSNGTARVTLYLRDDGGTANGGQNTSATQTFDITVNAVNDAPSFNTGANVTVLEDSGAYSAAFATSIDDGDPETTQTVSFVVAAANTTLFAVQPTVNSVGVLSFTPANNSNGTTTVDIYLRDDGGTANGGQNTSATQTFNISITPVNDAPSFTTIANVTVNEDAGATTATVVNNINDGDAETTQTLAFVVTNNNAALFTVQPTVNSVGVVNFTPVGNSNGTARVTLYLRDDGGTANGGLNTSATQTFDITVNAVNDAPSFNTGANVTVLEDSGAYSAAFATSIDDGDPETTQTVSFVVAAANTTLFAVQPTVNSVGVLSFTPANNSNGTTTVDIYLRDDGGTANGGQNTSATQTFNISITPVNDAPSFATGATVNVLEDSGLYAAAFATSIDDGDAETSQTLTFNVTHANTSLFSSQPTISASGVLNFTPANNATGSALVSVFLMDDGGTANGGQNTSATQMFSINVAPVNDPPIVSTSNTSAATLEDQPVVLAVSVFDTDTDLASLTLTATSANTAILPDANITQIGANAAISQFAVTTAVNTNGSVLITFTVDDGFSTSTTTITLDITPVNDAPSFTTFANVTVTEDAGATMATVVNNINDGDQETAQTLSFVVTNSNAALFTVQPTVSSVGVVNFTPVGNSNGTARVTLYLRDDGGTANGGLNTSATQTFDITVNAVNDAPTFSTGANVIVLEDSGAYSAAFATGIDDGDPETTQTISFVVTTANSSLFVIQPTVNSVGVLTFTPANNSNGTTTVDIYLRDNGGTANGGINTSATQSFRINVTPVNDAPEFATGANVTVLEDSGAYNAAFATGIDDGDGETSQTVSFVVTTANAALFSVQPTVNSVGNLSFTPAANTNGSTSVDIYIRDDGGTANGGVNTSATQRFTINITPVNDPPAFTTGANVIVLEDSGAYSAAFATGIDDGDAGTNQTVSFVVTTANAALFSVQPTINSVGNLSFTPAGNANGQADLQVFAIDNGGTANGGVNTSATQSFRIEVTPVNDAPEFATGANITVLEDSGAYSAAFATGIDDGDGETSQTVSFVVTTANAALFSVQPTVNSVGNLSFTPAANTNGSTSVDIYIRDDGGTANGGVNTSATQRFTINITPVNDPPAFTTGANVIVLEDSGAYSAAFATGIDDGDAGTNQTVSFVVTTANAALFSVQPTINSVGNLSFTPAGNANGQADLQVFAIDNGGTANGGVNTSATQSFRIEVTPVNDAPVFTTTSNLVVDAGSTAAAVIASGIGDGDPETTQTLTFHVTTSDVSVFSSFPTVSVTSGIINFIVISNTSARVAISLSLSDNGGTADGGVDTSATQTIYVEINNFNQPPVFSTGAKVTVAEDSSLYSAAFATGIDDGNATTTQSLTFHVVATNASLFSSRPTISTTGVLHFTPATNAFGTTAVLVSLSDDGPSTGGNVNTSATQTFYICITPVNDAPTIAPIADLSVQESGATTVSVLIGDVDTPIGELQVSATSSNPALLTSGSFSFSATAASMTLTMTPNCGSTGPVDVTVTVLDPTGVPLTSTATFELLVTPAPSFTVAGLTLACPRTTVEYNMPVFVGATYSWEVTNGILVGGQGTTVASVNWESGTTGSIRASVLTPAGCTFSSILVVSSINVAANPDYSLTGTGASVTFNVLTNDIGDAIELIGASDPANGSLTTSASGQITYTPDVGFEGFDSFTYTIRDAAGCIETGASVQVVVTDQVDLVNLHFVERIKDRSGGVRGLNGARATAVSPDGKHVYIAGQFDSSIPWFTRNTADGTLSYEGRARHNNNGVLSMKYPTGLVVSPDGKFVYVAAYGSGALVSFTRNSATGELSYLERKRNGKFDAGKKIVGMSRPIDITISSDGKSLYLTGYSDNSVVVFRRDINTGLVQFVERHKDGSGGVDGLRYPLGLAVSSDGKNVYVAGSGDNAIAIFDRDVTTGELTYNNRVKDGYAGVDGLADAADVCVSPDGNNVYAAGYGDEAVAVFDRAVDGGLSYVNRITGGLLDGVHGLICAPNGIHVYTAAVLDDAVAVLERDPDTGELTYMEALRDNVDGAEGLNGSIDIAISPDGRHAYSAGFDEKSVAVVYRNRVPRAKTDVGISVVKNMSASINVLNNDVEKDDGESLTITAKTDGALGTVAITGGGTTVTYTAGATTGADSFTYTIEDGMGGSSTATVHVDVTLSKQGIGLTQVPEQDINIHPNPVSATANIDLDNVADSELDVYLVDFQGRRVADLFSGSNRADQLRLIWDSRRNLTPAGTYTLVVERRLQMGALERRQATLRVVR